VECSSQTVNQHLQKRLLKSEKQVYNYGNA